MCFFNGVFFHSCKPLELVAKWFFFWSIEPWIVASPAVAQPPGVGGAEPPPLEIGNFWKSCKGHPWKTFSVRPTIGLSRPSLENGLAAPLVASLFSRKGATTKLSQGGRKALKYYNIRFSGGGVGVYGQLDAMNGNLTRCRSWYADNQVWSEGTCAHLHRHRASCRYRCRAVRHLPWMVRCRYKGPKGGTRRQWVRLLSQELLASPCMEKLQEQTMPRHCAIVKPALSL